MVVKIICRSLLQKTFVVEDYYLTTPTEFTVTGNYPNGYRILSDFSFTNNDWELSFDAKFQSNNVVFGFGTIPFSDVRGGIGRQGVGNIVYSLDGVDGSLWTVKSSYGSNYRSFKIVKQGNTLEYYQEDTFVVSTTSTELNEITEWGLYFRTWSNITAYAKNIKVKAL